MTPTELFQPSTAYAEIKETLRQLYLSDARPWLVGFSGGSPREIRPANHARCSTAPAISRGKDSALVAALVFEAALAVPLAQRAKEIHVVCTDTCVEIPAVVEANKMTLARMRKSAAEHDLKLEVHLLRPPAEQSFWVNIIGRGYPPPKSTFRWCTQGLKIDPVTSFVERRMGRWSEAILHLGARRAESATRAQTLAGRETCNGFTGIPTGRGSGPGILSGGLVNETLAE